MTVKESGLGWSCAKRDDSGTTERCIVNCVLNVDFSTPRNSQDSTGMDKSATERILLLGDYQSNWSGVFNDACNVSFCVHKTVTSADVARTEKLVISGKTLNNEVLLTDFSLTRATSGEFTWAGPAVLQSGTDPTWS